MVETVEVPISIIKDMSDVVDYCYPREFKNYEEEDDVEARANHVFVLIERVGEYISDEELLKGKNPPEEAGFICPKCGNTQIESVTLDVTAVAPILLGGLKEGQFGECGDSNLIDGEFGHYQCSHCGFVLDCKEDELYSYLMELKNNEKVEAE